MSTMTRLRRMTSSLRDIHDEMTGAVGMTRGAVINAKQGHAPSGTSS